MFNSVASRNAHVVLGECDLVEPPPTFEGVGEGTIYELKALVSSWDQGILLPLSDEEKYARIWEVVFPGEEFYGISSGTGSGRQRSWGS